MKLMMVAGGLLGFVVGLSMGLVQEGTWPTVITRASASALVVGFLFRWWSHLWLRSLQEANQLRWRKARQEAAKAEAADQGQAETTGSAMTAGSTHQP